MPSDERPSVTVWVHKFDFTICHDPEDPYGEDGVCAHGLFIEERYTDKDGDPL